MTDLQALPPVLTIDGDGAGMAVIPSEPDCPVATLPSGTCDVIAHLQRLNPVELQRVGLAPQQVLRILTLIADVRRLDCALPAAQALAHRIEQSRLDRAQQIATLLGDMAAQARRSVEADPQHAELVGPLSDLFEPPSAPPTKAPSTRRKLRALKTDDAPLSAHS